MPDNVILQWITETKISFLVELILIDNKQNKSVTHITWWCMLKRKIKQRSGDRRDFTGPELTQRIAIVDELREVRGWEQGEDHIYIHCKNLRFELVGRNWTVWTEEQSDIIFLKSLPYAPLRWIMEKVKKPVIRICHKPVKRRQWLDYSGKLRAVIRNYILVNFGRKS